MLSLGKQLLVREKFDIINGVVKFTGEYVNIVMAVSKIKDMNLSYMSESQLAQNRHIRWQYEGSGGNFTNFSVEQDNIIEKAFNDGCPEVRIVTQNNIIFKIIFEEWKEYCVSGNTQGRPKSIRRLDLPKGGNVCLRFIKVY